MEGLSLADYGVLGVFLFMIFQYIIKPIMTSFLERRKSNGNPGHAHTPCNSQQMQDMMNILTKRDDKQRPVVWGYCQKEAIEELTKAVRELTAKLE